MRTRIYTIPGRSSPTKIFFECPHCGIFKDITGQGICCDRRCEPTKPPGARVYQPHFSEGLGRHVSSTADEKEVIGRIEEDSRGMVSLAELGPGERPKMGQQREARAKKMMGDAHKRAKRECWQKGLLKGLVYDQD